MTTWYRLERYGKPQITPVEVIKETAEFITVRESYSFLGEPEIRERRCRKSDEYWPTFEAARQCGIDTYQREAERHQDARSRALSRRAEYERMKKPEISA